MKAKEKIQIERLRTEFIFFGHDTANMTDEEIKEGVKNVAKAIGSFGATAKEAETALRVLGNVGTKEKAKPSTPG